MRGHMIYWRQVTSLLSKQDRLFCFFSLPEPILYAEVLFPGVNYRLSWCHVAKLKYTYFLHL